eukprot:5891022-Amphidinium_carterae.1
MAEEQSEHVHIQTAKDIIYDQSRTMEGSSRCSKNGPPLLVNILSQTTQKFAMFEAILVGASQNLTIYSLALKKESLRGSRQFGDWLGMTDVRRCKQNGFCFLGSTLLDPVRDVPDLMDPSSKDDLMVPMSRLVDGRATSCPPITEESDQMCGWHYAIDHPSGIARKNAFQCARKEAPLKPYNLSLVEPST